MAFRSISTLDGGPRSGGMTPTEPTGAAQDDILWAFAHWEDNSPGITITPPANWSAAVFDEFQTAPTPDLRFAAYWIRRGASAPAFNWTWTGSKYCGIAVAAYSGRDTTVDPPEVLGARTNGTDTSAEIASLTTLTDNADVIYGIGCWETTDFTVATGTTPTYTERADTKNLATGDGVLATAGATGANSSTLSAATPAGWITAIVDLRLPQAAITAGEMAAAQQQGTRDPYRRQTSVISYSRLPRLAPAATKPAAA